MTTYIPKNLLVGNSKNNQVNKNYLKWTKLNTLAKPGVEGNSDLGFENYRFLISINLILVQLARLFLVA